jgi:hypothetical protein
VALYGQSDQATCPSHQPNLDLAQSELGTGVGHHHVTGERDLTAATHREAIDRRYDGPIFRSV